MESLIGADSHPPVNNTDFFSFGRSPGEFSVLVCALSQIILSC